MASFIQRSISIYQEKGATTLYKRALRKLRQDAYCKLATLRGHYSLSLEGKTVNFLAPTPKIVRRNRGRFISEKEELKDLVNEIKEDDVVYDIGANTGLHSLFAAKSCVNGKVIAFEPYPPNICLLREDISRNKIQNIDVIEVVLSDSVGTVQFNQPEEDDVGYGSSSIVADKSVSTINVLATTGDQLIREGKIPEPNVIKIDVEGSETLVIDGLENALSDPRCRLLYCEVHLPGVNHRPSIEDFGSTLDDLCVQLGDMGFKVPKVYPRGEYEVFLKAEK